MSRDRKRQFSWYQVDDTEAVARHLEKMAGKGWLLEKVDNWFFTYRRSQPEKITYTVTFFPEASVFDPGLTQGQETYADYCRAAGWELAAAYGPIQYFRSVRPDPTPIETDEAVKLAAIRRTMRKTSVLSYALLLILPAMCLPLSLGQFRRDPMKFFSSNHQLAMLLLMVGIVLFSLGILLDYLIWVLRSRHAVSRGGACVRPHTRFRMGLSAVMMALCAAILAVFLLDPPLSGMRGFLAACLVLYGGIMALSRRVLRSLKKRGVSRNNTKGIYFVFAVAVGLAVGIGTPVLFAVLDGAGLIHIGREPAETYTKTYENVSWTYTQDVFHDELPVTLEELGYTVTPEDHCTYEAESSRSPLAVRAEYTQDALSWDSQLPRLTCQVYDTRWSWLLDRCWKELTGEGEGDPWPLQKLDPAPWGAEAAYQEIGYQSYFLLYPDRIVTFHLSGGSATPEQLDAIAQALTERSHDSLKNS